MSIFDKLTAQIPLLKQKPTSEYFFALNISISCVTGAVWELSHERVEIIGQKDYHYLDNEDLLEKANMALDQALGVLEVEPKKMLIGVPDVWMEEEDLKEPYLKLLRRMVKEYELEPMAYVATTQALEYYLQKLEGIPPTAVLVGIDEAVVVSVIKVGKIIGVRSVKKSGEIFSDIEKALLEFSEVEVMPAKILLYSSIEDLDKLNKTKDVLVSHHWLQKLSFLHLPKIEVLPSNIVLQGVITAGASEISDLNLKHSFLMPPSVQDVESHPSLLGEEPEKREFGGARLTRLRPREKELDFVAGDIAESEKEESGFKEANLLAVPEQMAMQTTASLINQGEKELDKFQKVVQKISEHIKLPRIRFPRRFNFGFSRSVLAAIPIILIILGYVFLSKAAVTIFVEPKVLTNDAIVVADPKASAVDNEKKIIPGVVVETITTATGKATATGQKQIGDPAKGVVVIYNKTTSQKDLSTSTTLTSSSGLKFTLDSAVSVASQSSTVGADFTTVISPGKSSTVGVSAVAIGPESNLPAGTNLSVANFSQDQVVARVDQALSGGTSKDVTVVTADDQKKLQAQVVDVARKKAQEELQVRIVDKRVIAEALVPVDGQYNFTKRVNDQASEFSLSASVRFRGTAYRDADLKVIVSKLVETNVPEGFELNLNETETQADVSKVEKDGRLIFMARFKEKLIPKFNLDELKNKIKGKSVKEVAETLKNMENVLESNFKLSPPMPGPIARLPFIARNISIVVSPK